MPIIDVVILIVIAGGMILGIKEGFAKQLASTIGIIVGFLVARSLYISVAERADSLFGISSQVTQLIAFVVIWGAVPVIFMCISSLLTKILDTINMGWLDRWLGGVLSALKYLFVLSAIVHGIEHFAPNSSFISKADKDKSIFYYPVKELSSFFFPLVKDITKQLTI